MSKETKEQATAPETTAEIAAEEQPATKAAKPESITLELEDLTEEGKKKIEESLGRPVVDLTYSVASQESREGSVVAMTFEVEREAYLAEQERLLNDLRKEVVLPGFRKGKAPLKLLQIRMGDEAVRDTFRSVGTNVLRQENAKQELKIFSKPQIVFWEAPVADTNAKLEIEVEVEPKVEVKQYKGLTVEAEIHPVTDEAVAQRIEQMRGQNAVLESAGDKAKVNPEDVITVDIEVTNENGERLAHLCREGEVVHNIKASLPEKIAEEIIGKKVGDTVTAMIENTSTNRRGEQVTHSDQFAVTVREIKVNRLPELDDEFAKDLGDYKDLTDLRAKVREGLEKAENDRQRGEALAKLYQKIVELNPVDPPRSMLSHQQYELIMQDSYQLARMGLRLEQVIQDTDQYLAKQHASADEMVKVRMLSQAIAEAEGLEVTDADVDQAIEDMAKESGRKALAIRARLEAQKQLDGLKSDLSRRKLADFLLASNTVEKVEAKPEAEEGEAEAEAKPKKTAKKAAPKKKAEAEE